MSATSATSTTPFGRRIKFMAIFIALLVVLVVAAWFIGAQIYRGAIDEGRTALASEGVTLTCADESLGGFPARFEWRCSSLSISTASGGQLSGGAFNTVAPVWNPLFTIAEWTGPFRSVSADGFDADIASDLLRASIRLNTSLELERLSAVLDPFSVTLQSAPQAIVSANQAEMHVRQPLEVAGGANAATGRTGDNDLEVALVLFGLESPFLGGVNQIDMSITALMEELASIRARSLQHGLRAWVERSGRITPLTTRLRLDDHAINLDGDGVIGADGRIGFDGAIATNDVAALVDLMGIDASNNASAITAGAMLFGRQTTIGEDTATELPLRVSQGAVSIGPVPLGVLPPLRF
ncbi:MAG: DUF2125 domain-containing protein [Hyphomicrobiales bacterium]